ncbi:hypothetical protein VDGL01_00032, partial [Verticillium dahliae]
NIENLTVPSAALPEPQTKSRQPATAQSIRPPKPTADCSPRLSIPDLIRTHPVRDVDHGPVHYAFLHTHTHTHTDTHTRPGLVNHWENLKCMLQNPTHASYLLLPPRKAASLLVDSPRLPAQPTPIMRPASACLPAPSSRPAQA